MIWCGLQLCGCPGELLAPSGENQRHDELRTNPEGAVQPSGRRSPADGGLWSGRWSPTRGVARRTAEPDADESWRRRRILEPGVEGEAQ
jgi:hypothetical protein